MSELDTFDPNTRPNHEWATFCPGRIYNGGSKFKIHAQRGHALSGLANQNSGILYRWVGTQWVELLRKDPSKRPGKCERCGENTTITSTHANRTYTRDTTRFVVLRDPNGKLPPVNHPLHGEWRCDTCRNMP